MDINTIKELLKEQNNTRNFSHMYTKSGETIRADIMRSNILSTKDQTSTLIADELKTIIDLRISAEGGGDKNLIYSDAMLNHLPISFGNLSLEKISELLGMGNIEEIDSFMKNGYRSFSSDFITEVKAFFSILLNEDALPVAFHCTAGKDRTGMLTALFLLGLDVSKEDVINDYMESNNRIDTKGISQEIDEYLRSNSSIQLPYSEQSIQTLEMLFAVRKGWIEIFILGIEESFGSIESYLQDEIKLDIEGLKKIYLIA